LMMRNWLFFSTTLLVALLTAACGPANAPAGQSGDALLVAAASDLQFAFAEIGPAFEQKTGRTVEFVFGSTGNLTTQIENGAPFDLLAAANVSYIDRLAEGGFIVPGTSQLYGQGRVVLAVNRQAGVQATQLTHLTDPAISRIAIANPAHAPYGTAAQEALRSAGLWDTLQPKLVLAENVRQTLQFVQTGDVPVGIVALSVADVPEIAFTPIPANLHNPINQAIAVVNGSPREADARAFIEFVNSPAGRVIMKKYGFSLPGEF